MFYATLNLKQLNVTNSAGDAVVMRSTGSNGRGLYVNGHGDGDGAAFISGSNGDNYGILASANNAGSGTGNRRRW